MRQENKPYYIYDLDNERWLRLAVSSEDGSFQLFTRPDKASNDTWSLIEFPNVLTAWDDNLRRVNRYFIHEEKLHHYFQTFGIIAPALLAKNNTEAINKILKHSNGFIFINESNKRDGCGQQIRVFNGENWETIKDHTPFKNMSFYVELKDYSSDTFETPPKNLLLPMTFTPPELKLSTDSAIDEEWKKEREEEILEFDKYAGEINFAETSLPWQLDTAARQKLLEFKENTKSKQEYLSSLEMILHGVFTEDLLDPNLVQDIGKIRRFIRQPPLNFEIEKEAKIIIDIKHRRNVSNKEAINIFNDQISTYLLTRFKQEYERVAKPDQVLPIEISVGNLPPFLKTEKSHSEVDETHQLYSHFINVDIDQNYNRVYEAYAVYCHLESDYLPRNNIYDRVSGFLQTEYGGPGRNPREAAKLFLRNYIAKALYPYIPSNDLEALAAWNPSQPSIRSDLDGKYLPYIILFNAYARDRFIQNIEDASEGYDEHTLKNLCIMHADIAVAAISSEVLSRALGARHLLDILMEHEDAALLLLEDNARFYYSIFSGRHAKQLIQKHPRFKSELLNKLELLIIFPGEGLEEIACADYDFAEKILQDKNLSKKLSTENYCKIAKAHTSLAMALFENGYSTLFNELSSEQLFSIADSNANFAAKLLEAEPKRFLRMDLNNICNLLRKYSALQTAFPNDLSQLVPESLPIFNLIYLAIEFEFIALALADKKNSAVTDQLSDNDIDQIAYYQVKFALHMLNNPTLRTRLGITLSDTGLAIEKEEKIIKDIEHHKNVSIVLRNHLRAMGRHVEVVIAFINEPWFFYHAIDGFFGNRRTNHNDIKLLGDTLLSHWNRVLILAHDHIYEIALENSDFAVELLRKSSTSILKADQIHAIALEHADFAIELLNNPTVSRLTTDQIFEFAEIHPAPTLTFLKKLKDSEQLTPELSATLAMLDENHAIEYFRDARNVWNNRPGVTSRILDLHTSALTKLFYAEPELLNNMNPRSVDRAFSPDEPRIEDYNEYTTPVIDGLKLDFVELFSERPELLNSFEQTTIYNIASRIPDFAIFLLEKHPEQIKKMESYQLRNIIVNNTSSFAEKFIEWWNPENYNEAMNRNIVSGYAAHISKIENLAIVSGFSVSIPYDTSISLINEFFRNRKLQPYLSDDVLYTLVSKNRQQALAILEDEGNFLEEVNLSEDVLDYYTSLACNYPTIAYALAKRSSFLAKFKESRLTEISIQHSDFATSIDPEAFDQFSSEQLVALAKSSSKFAMSLFDHPETLKRIANKYFSIKTYDTDENKYDNDDIKFITKLYLETDYFDRDIYLPLFDLAYFNYNIALLLTKKPAALEKVDLRHLKNLATKWENFAIKLVKIPSIYAMLDSSIIRHVFLYMPTYNSFTLSKISDGFRTCYDPELFNRATTNQLNVFHGTFSEFKNLILDKLAGYNARIYLLPESDDATPPTFSHEHLQNIIQCKSVDELKKVLEAIKSKMKPTISIYSVFRQANHLKWLDHCINHCNQCQLNLTTEDEDLKAVEECTTSSSPSLSMSPENH